MEDKKGEPSILIIDDSLDFREIMSAKLRSAGFEVFEAESGEAGIAKALEKRPDLVLLDIEMPNMSGPQVLSKFKADPTLQGLNIVFLTNHGESNEESVWLDKKFANEIGASGYIRKTEDLNKIVSDVREILKNAVQANSTN